MLELGCGAGRVLNHATPSTAQGVGVDIDEELLELARAAARSRPHSTALSFQRGDMRSVRLGARFDRVILPFGCLYCLQDDQALAETMTTIREHLDDDGLMIADVYAADGFHQEEQLPEDEETFDPWQPVGTVDARGTTFEVEERSRWIRSAQRIEAEYRYRGANGEELIAPLPQRYLLAEQLLLALMEAGLEPIALWGDFSGTPFDPDGSDRLVLVAGLASAVGTPGASGEPTAKSP